MAPDRSKLGNSKAVYCRKNSNGPHLSGLWETRFPL